jgi:hypothetical protein
MRQSREGTAEYVEYSQKALEARTKLARYVGADKPWTRACIDDPEAIQTAERLVRGGLRRAAADHTNAGRALVEEALRIGEKSERDVVFERALKEYQLAAQGWEGYLSQDENAADAYESRFWLADAHHMIVVVTVAMDRTPTAAQVEVARKTAVDVRDSNEDDKYLQPSAFFVVDVAYQMLRDQHKRFKSTNGVEGFEERDGLVLEGEGTDKVKVVRSPVPQPLLDTVRAREEYVRIVPPAADVMTEFESVKVPQSMAYTYDNANAFFMYGDFAEARKRFEPIYAEQCGKTPFGYKAWERLTTMSNLENDVETQPRSRRGRAHQELRGHRRAEAHRRGHREAHDLARLLPRRCARLREGREDVARPRARQGLARGRGALQGRAREGARPRRGSRGRDPRRQRLQAGRRVRPGDRDVRAVHPRVRQRAEAHGAREGRSEGRASGQGEPRQVPGARRQPEARLRRARQGLRALLLVPPGGRDLRHREPQRALREGGAPSGREERARALFEPRRRRQGAVLEADALLARSARQGAGRGRLPRRALGPQALGRERLGRRREPLGSL